MRYPDFNYVDSAMGGANNRSNPVLIAGVKALLPEDPVDCYCTWHRFPKRYYQHWEHNIVERKGVKRRSVSGYRGPSYADFLPFDFDAESLEKAQAGLRMFLGYLEATYGVTEGMRIHFSGNRGFHVCLPAALFGGWDASEALPGQLKRLAVRLADGGEGIDEQVYDQNRLWRIPNTRHSKSGLWKIPLSVTDALVMPPDAIRDRAQNFVEVDAPFWDDVEAVDGLVELYGAVCDEQPEKKPVVRAGDMFSTELKEGDGRQERAFQLACKMKGWGVPFGAALEMLGLWDRSLAQSLEETDGAGELERVLRNAYGDEAGQGDRVCIDAIRSLRDLAEDYKRYVETLKGKTIRLGFPQLDRVMRGIAPGEVCTVIAKTSVGKTAFAQNVLRNIGRDQQAHSLFLSMEQPKAQVFERWAQMVTGHRGMDIERGWDEESFRAQVVQELQRDVGNRIWTCDLPHLKAEEIEALVWTAQEKCGGQLGMVAIDYIGLLDMKALDRTLYGQVSEAARSLKTLAKKVNLAVMALCQVSRSPEDHGDKPLHISSARESGAIEESCDFMLALYRPGIERKPTQEHPHGTPDDTMIVQLLKNRKGNCGKVTCNFEGDTLRITQQADEEEVSGSTVDYRESADRPDRAAPAVVRPVFDPDKEALPF